MAITTRPFTSPNEKTLFIGAHPDDELLFGGGIDTNVRNGAEVHTVLATQGKASPHGHPDFVRQGRRVEEAQSALSEYGVPSHQQHQFDLPDGQLTLPDQQLLLTDKIEGLITTHGITTVITLGARGADGHLDHVASHLAATEAARRYRVVYPLIRVLGLATTGIHHVPVDPSRKLRIARNHQSQFEIDVSNPAYEPRPETLEQPGIRLGDGTNQRLIRHAAPYFVYEAYQQESLFSDSPELSARAEV